MTKKKNIHSIDSDFNSAWDGATDITPLKRPEARAFQRGEDVFDDNHLRQNLGVVRNAGGLFPMIKQLIKSGLIADAETAVIRSQRKLTSELTGLVEERRKLEQSRSEYENLAAENALRGKRMEKEYASFDADIEEHKTRGFKARTERLPSYGEKDIREKEKDLKLEHLAYEIAQTIANTAALKRRQSEEPSNQGRAFREGSVNRRVMDKVSRVVEGLVFEEALKKAGSVLSDEFSPDDKEFIQRQIRKSINEERER